MRSRQIIYEAVIRCLNESFWRDAEISFAVNDLGDEIDVSIYRNGDEMGYAILIPHDKMSSLYNEISDTDSYEMAEQVVSKLNANKPIIEIADVDVNKNYRNNGVSKKLIEYISDNYKDYQFYLRVCPTDGIDEYTFVNVFKKYGFIEIDRNDENGTFMIKK